MEYPIKNTMEYPKKIYVKSIQTTNQYTLDLNGFWQQTWDCESSGELGASHIRGRTMLRYSCHKPTLTGDGVF